MRGWVDESARGRRRAGWTFPRPRGRGSIEALERLYSDEYLAIDPAGATFTRAQDIANVKSGNFKLATFKLDDVKLKVHGEMDVVTGRNTIKGTYMGKDISGVYRFTDAFVKRAGRWQVLSTQGTAIAPPPAKWDSSGRFRPGTRASVTLGPRLLVRHA